MTRYRMLAALLCAWPLTCLNAAPLPKFGPADSLLVVAPHPDDESLCCAGAIQRALDAGASVSIVWLTSGDAFATDAMLVEHTLKPGTEGLRHLAQQRMNEAGEAARTLGVGARDQFFLGYPDRGLLDLLVDHYVTPFLSSHTGALRVPYPRTLSPQAEYTGSNLERDFGSVLKSTRPTMVLAPSPLDFHPDHRAAGSLTVRAMTGTGQIDRVRYWIVHAGPGWPEPHGLHAEQPFTPPRSAAGLQWVELPLTPDEREVKRAAISAHRSQMEIMRPFLMAFVRSSEWYATTPVAYPSSR